MERHNRRVSTDAKPIVAAYWQAYNAAEWDALRGLVAEDYVHHSGDAESHDVDFFVAGAMGLRAAFPDVRVEVRDMVAGLNVMPSQPTPVGRSVMICPSLADRMIMLFFSRQAANRI